MLNLTDAKTSYILFTPDPNQNGYTMLCEKYTSITHSKGYNDMELLSSDQEFNYAKSYLSFYEDVDNNKLRANAIYLMDTFGADSVIVKYHGEDIPKRILENGSERLLNVVFYGDLNERVYTQYGISFQFETLKRYYFPTQKEHFKKDMVVELYNDTTWIEYKINDLDSEWEDVFKLFVKYEKVRISRD